MIFSKLMGQFVDIVEWIDDTPRHDGLALPALRQRDQERRQADRPRGPGGGVRQRGPARRRLRARHVHAQDATTCRSSPRSRAGSTASRARSRPRSTSSRPRSPTQVGHEEPDHAARPGVRPGAGARVRHLRVRINDPATFIKEIVGTNGQLHHRRDRRPAPQHDRRRASARSSRADPRPRPGGQLRRARQVRHRADRPTSANYGLELPSSWSRTSRCRPRSSRRSTSAPRWASSATWPSTPSSRPPRRWDGGRQPRRRRRRRRSG